MIYYIILCLAVFIGSAAQLLIKSRLTAHGMMPTLSRDTVYYVFRLAIDPAIVLAAIMLLSAAMSWYFVVSRIPLSIAFAFAALSYPIVLLGAYAFLREPVSLMQVLGNLLIVGGIVIVAASGRMS